MFGIRKIFSNAIVSLTVKQRHILIRQASQKSNKNRFIIVRVTPKDFREVVDLLRYSYFNGEPTMVAAGLAYKSNPIMENNILECLSQGMSLMAKCRGTGQVIGAAINVGLCPWDPDLQDDYADTCTCPKLASVLRFYSHITRKANLWQKFNEYKIFEITYLATDVNNQGMGVGRELIVKSIELAKDLSYTLLRIDATSVFTSKICHRLKMAKVDSTLWKSYVDCNGKPIFLPPPPHEYVDVFIELPHATPELRQKIFPK